MNLTIIIIHIIKFELLSEQFILRMSSPKHEIPYDPSLDDCVWDGKKYIKMVPQEENQLAKCLTINDTTITVDDNKNIK